MSFVVPDITFRLLVALWDKLLKEEAPPRAPRRNPPRTARSKSR
jgi:hypothetical protein